MMTRWGRAIDPEHVLEEYPRPEMVRESYLNLNGMWDYAITGSKSFPQRYDGKILVPFSPEAPLSGVNRILQPGGYLHYERQITLHREEEVRYLLHFGAVDQTCAVYVNGKMAGEHTGGYLAFSLDITALLRDGKNLLHVTVRDEFGYFLPRKGKAVASARRDVVHASERDLAERVDGKGTCLPYREAEDHAGL